MQKLLLSENRLHWFREYYILFLQKIPVSREKSVRFSDSFGSCAAAPFRKEGILMSSIFLGKESNVRRVWTEPLCLLLEQEAALESRTVYDRERILAEGPFPQVREVFSTWGMPVLSEEEIRANFPNLEAVYYAAGSVQRFARPFLNCGVRVHSAWAANAVPVAEFTFAEISLANKGFFLNCRRYSQADFTGARAVFTEEPGNFGIRVGLIGVGMIGSMVAQKLQALDVEVLGFDPFLSDERAAALHVRKASLEEIFSECQTVSNHLANNPQTVGMLDYALFSRLPHGAVFLNTARAAQVVEEDLIRFLQERPDACAVLDVGIKEPLPPEDPLYRLPNAFLTTHIAGSSGNEVQRMAQYMLAERRRVEAGEAPLYRVTAEMLKTMA